MSIVSRYEGAEARNYERKRSKARKWAFETETLVQILSELEPQSVIDAPVGTGRFLHLYSGAVTGIDFSGGMLAEARAKRSGATLVKRDLLKAGLNITADLVVCFRFMNFVAPADLPRVLGALLDAAERYAAFTIRTIEDDYKGKPTVGKITLYRRSVIYGIVAAHGFAVKKRYVFKDTVGGDYSILLCQRSAHGA